MADFLSLADAAHQLDLSSERVRQLVVAGDMPGVRFGNAWVVPRDAVLSRRRSKSRPGRPLGARGAWNEILEGNVDLSNVSRYRNRAMARRFLITNADLACVRNQQRIAVSGVEGAIAHGEPIAPVAEQVDLYLPESEMEQVRGLVALVADVLSPVIFRVVPEACWPMMSAQDRLAPPAAVALDLVERGDPREWLAAEALLADDT